jgi:hypothetical protein
LGSKEISRRQAIFDIAKGVGVSIFVAGGGLGLVELASLALAGCGATPDPERVSPPRDAVSLYDQPDHLVRVPGIDLYQETRSDSPELPFNFFVSPSALRTLAERSRNEGWIGAGERALLVIRWPGSEDGGGLHCVGTRPVGVDLDLAAPVDQLVYQSHFNNRDLSSPEIREDFLALAERRINLQLFHELSHFPHCRAGMNAGDSAVRAEAREWEARLARELPRVIFIEAKPGYDLNSAFQK